MSEELAKRASDTEREHVVVRLRDASTEGRLTLEELADRTALAYRARSHAELEPLTADLPAAAAPAAPAVRPRRRWLVSALAPVSRSGRALGERNVVISLLAPARLDLRQMQLPSGEAAITVFSLFAPVFVTVPEHVEVDSSVIALLAPVHEGPSGDIPPNAPCLRIRGLSLFAPVSVQHLRS